MFGDAIKRLEYAVRQGPSTFMGAPGAPTDAYYRLFETIEIMLMAIGEDALARELERMMSWRLLRGETHDLFQHLRDEGIANTPFDKLIPWTYRAVTQAPFLYAELYARGAAIMQWQAATRTDINKLTVAQVLVAVDAWETTAKPAKNVGEVVYRFRDGWTVQRLDTNAALKEEGRLLHHCVGGYCEQVAAGESVIFSLRDPANVPRITMEWDPVGKRFVQIHGDKNAAPTPDVQPYLVEVIMRVFRGALSGLLLTGVPLKELDLRGVDWSNTNLRKANLAGVKLDGAILAEADLEGADLTKATLIKADLLEASLYEAALPGADLTGAVLTEALMVDANLHKTVLTGANLSGANLTGAVLTGAVLTGAIFDETTILPDGRRWSPPAGLGHHRRRRHY